MPALPSGAVFLLHLNENSNDASGQNHVQVDGSAVTWDTTNKVFGSASMLNTRDINNFISSTNHADWALAATDFTLDFRALLSVFPISGNFDFLIGQYDQTVPNPKSWRVQISASSFNTGRTIVFQFSTGGTSPDGLLESNNINSPAGAGLFQTGTFNHIRICRKTDNLYFFVNGTACGTQAITATLATVNQVLRVGGAIGQSAFSHTGNLDEVLILKGNGLSTDSFEVPTEEWGTVPAAAGGNSPNFILLGVG